MRIGPRYDTQCVEICNSSGHVIPWANEIRYLGFLLLDPGYLNARWMSLSGPFTGLLMQSSEKLEE